MTQHRISARLAVLAVAALILVPVASAIAATPLEQAELAGLSPEMQAQVKARAVGGNSVTEVLQVMLLNNIKVKHEASLIVALDWAKGVAVVQLPSGGMAVVHFELKNIANQKLSPGSAAAAGARAFLIVAQEDRPLSDLLVIEFPSEEKAEGVRETLLAMQQEYLIELGDAVVAVKDANGRIKLNQLFQPVKQGAVSGLFWGSLIGLLFLNPLAGAAIGAASGALGGKLTDLGINDDFMKQAAQNPAIRQCRTVPADPENDDGQGVGGIARRWWNGAAQLVRRIEGGRPAGGAREGTGGHLRSRRLKFGPAPGIQVTLGED